MKIKHSIVTPQIAEAASNIYYKMYNGRSVFKYDGVIFDVNKEWDKFLVAVAKNVQKANNKNPNKNGKNTINIDKKTKKEAKPIIKDVPVVNKKTANDKKLAETNNEGRKTSIKHSGIVEAGIKGEINVEYEIKWLGPDYYPVTRNCMLKDKLCIALHVPDYVDEIQEIDHIVISDKSVFVIETKNYKGTLEIKDNGNWVRVSEDGKRTGHANPIAQLDRHYNLVATILKSLVSEKNIYRIICISNPSSVIVGENKSPVPVVKYDMLARKIKEIDSRKSPKLPVAKIIKQIEQFKVNKTKKA